MVSSPLQTSLFEKVRLQPELPVEIRGDDSSFLRASEAVPGKYARAIRAVDLFCGCGGISLGLREAAAAYEFGFEVALAADFESQALEVFRRNLDPRATLSDPLDTVFLHQVDAALSRKESELVGSVGQVDLLVGGPPCQGHSDLNNTTRRNDPKNALYLLMARAAAVLRPQAVLIENVVGAARDRSGVVQRTVAALQSLGYQIETLVLDGHEMGVPQRRRRLFLLASRTRKPNLQGRLDNVDIAQRDVRWAIGDLVGIKSEAIIDVPAVSAKETRARIDYLFDHDMYDLPDEQRPPCHRNNSHTYKSVYGRLRWDRPAQTITSGFYSMCMGRYVHPSLRRTLTAHEAARLQFFPDFFSFSSVRSRTTLATIIGNAVPPKLSYMAGLELLMDLGRKDRGRFTTMADDKQ